MIHQKNEFYLVCTCSWYRSRKIIENNKEFLDGLFDDDYRAKFISLNFESAFFNLRNNETYKNNLEDLLLLKCEILEDAILIAIQEHYFGNAINSNIYGIKNSHLFKILKVYNTKELLIIS